MDSTDAYCISAVCEDEDVSTFVNSPHPVVERFMPKILEYLQETDEVDAVALSGHPAYDSLRHTVLESYQGPTILFATGNTFAMSESHDIQISIPIRPSEFDKRIAEHFSSL